MYLRFISIGAAALALTACQDQLMSNDRMQSAIAGVLGVPPSTVTLTDRRSDGPTNTYVLAHLTNGTTYACTVNGGGLLAFGMMNPPMCHPPAMGNTGSQTPPFAGSGG